MRTKKGSSTTTKVKADVNVENQNRLAGTTTPFYDDEIPLQVGRAYDQKKVNEGYTDDDDFPEPYRFIERWYLTKTTSKIKQRVPLNLKSIFEDRNYLFYGYLIPADPTTRQPLFICIRNLESWTIDRSASLRGIWIHTTGAQKAWYWLREPCQVQLTINVTVPKYLNQAPLTATLPSMQQQHTLARALFGLVSNLSDIFSRESMYTDLQVKRNPSDLFALLSSPDDEFHQKYGGTNPKTPFDLELIKDYADFVRPHMFQFHTKLTDKCEFILGLDTLIKQVAVHKRKEWTQEQLIASAEMAEERSQRTQWGCPLENPMRTVQPSWKLDARLQIAKQQKLQKDKEEEDVIPIYSSDEAAILAPPKNKITKKREKSKREPNDTSSPKQVRVKAIRKKRLDDSDSDTDKPVLCETTNRRKKEKQKETPIDIDDDNVVLHTAKTPDTAKKQISAFASDSDNERVAVKPRKRLKVKEKAHGQAEDVATLKKKRKRPEPDQNITPKPSMKRTLANLPHDNPNVMSKRKKIDTSKQATISDKHRPPPVNKRPPAAKSSASALFDSDSEASGVFGNDDGPFVDPLEYSEDRMKESVRSLKDAIQPLPSDDPNGSWKSVTSAKYIFVDLAAANVVFERMVHANLSWEWKLLIALISANACAHKQTEISKAFFNNKSCPARILSEDWRKQAMAIMKAAPERRGRTPELFLITLMDYVVQCEVISGVKVFETMKSKKSIDWETGVKETMDIARSTGRRDFVAATTIAQRRISDIKSGKAAAKLKTEKHELQESLEEKRRKREEEQKLKEHKQDELDRSRRERLSNMLASASMKYGGSISTAATVAPKLPSIAALKPASRQQTDSVGESGNFASAPAPSGWGNSVINSNKLNAQTDSYGAVNSVPSTWGSSVTTSKGNGWGISAPVGTAPSAGRWGNSSCNVSSEPGGASITSGNANGWSKIGSAAPPRCGEVPSTSEDTGNSKNDVARVNSSKLNAQNDSCGAVNGVPSAWGSSVTTSKSNGWGISAPGATAPSAGRWGNSSCNVSSVASGASLTSGNADGWSKSGSTVPPRCGGVPNTSEDTGNTKNDVARVGWGIPAQKTSLGRSDDRLRSKTDAAGTGNSRNDVARVGWGTPAEKAAPARFDDRLRSKTDATSTGNSKNDVAHVGWGNPAEKDSLARFDDRLRSKTDATSTGNSKNDVARVGWGNPDEKDSLARTDGRLSTKTDAADTGNSKNDVARVGWGTPAEKDSLAPTDGRLSTKTDAAGSWGERTGWDKNPKIHSTHTTNVTSSGWGAPPATVAHLSSGLGGDVSSQSHAQNINTAPLKNASGWGAERSKETATTNVARGVWGTPSVGASSLGSMSAGSTVSSKPWGDAPVAVSAWEHKRGWGGKQGGATSGESTAKLTSGGDDSPALKTASSRGNTGTVPQLDPNATRSGPSRGWGTTKSIEHIGSNAIRSGWGAPSALTVNSESSASANGTGYSVSIPAAARTVANGWGKPLSEKPGGAAAIAKNGWDSAHDSSNSNRGHRLTTERGAYSSSRGPDGFNAKGSERKSFSETPSSSARDVNMANPRSWTTESATESRKREPDSRSHNQNTNLLETDHRRSERENSHDQYKSQFTDRYSNSKSYYSRANQNDDRQFTSSRHDNQRDDKERHSARTRSSSRSRDKGADDYNRSSNRAPLDPLDSASLHGSSYSALGDSSDFHRLLDEKKKAELHELNRRSNQTMSFSTRPLNNHTSSSSKQAVLPSRGRGGDRNLPAWMTQKGTDSLGPPQSTTHHNLQSTPVDRNLPSQTRPPAFPVEPIALGRGRGRGLTLPAWMTDDKARR